MRMSWGEHPVSSGCARKLIGFVTKVTVFHVIGGKGSAMSTRERTLSGISLLQRLDPAERARLEKFCTWRTYSRGQVIIERGSPGADVIFLVDGVVQIFSLTPGGREVLFGTLAAGEYFGELAAIDGLPRSAAARARETALVAILPAIEFRHLLQTHAPIANDVLERVVRLVRACDDRIMTLSTLTAVQRVYSVLLDMAQPDAAGVGLWVVRPLPPMREIATIIATSRETVARAISQIRQRDIVRRKGRNLYILDREKLEEMLRSPE